MKTITKKFNDVGEQITIQLKYSDLEVSEFPESCASCPVGFMWDNCGREYPMGKHRPQTCKLKLVDFPTE